MRLVLALLAVFLALPAHAQETRVRVPFPEGDNWTLRLYGTTTAGAPFHTDRGVEILEWGIAGFYLPMAKDEIGGLVACSERYEKRACGEPWVSSAWTNLPEPGTPGILASVLLLIGLRRRRKAPGG